MITDAILNVFLGLADFIVGLLPDFSGAFSGFSSLVSSDFFALCGSLFDFVGYILPLPTVVSILTISLLISAGHIIWALVIRIKSFIPTMGS